MAAKKKSANGIGRPNSIWGPLDWTYSISLPEKWREAIEEFAAQERRSVPDAFRIMIEDRLKREELL